MKYDVTITSPGTPEVTQTIWVKKAKMRTEMTVQGQTTVLIMDTDAKTMYTYMPMQNTAIKMTWNPTTKSATDEATSVSSYNPTIVGTETIDGKVCTVVQYTVNGQTTKMWLWQEKGLPIRVEANTAQGTVVMVYKNISFVDIPDSQFTLPAGVQMMSIPGS
jgi:outer membrane lipoprotein-sorting protein